LRASESAQNALVRLPFLFDPFPSYTTRRTAARDARQALRPIALQIVEDPMILTPNR
jgi:hypothetical protein